MSSFSERYGHSSARTAIQVDSIDDELRNGLWNAVLNHYLQSSALVHLDPFGKPYPVQELSSLVRSLWMFFFKEPLDTIPNKYGETFLRIRDYYFAAPWYKVYDFIEFLPNNFFASASSDITNKRFINECNYILKQEMSAYRFSGTQIAPITEETELDAIDTARDLPPSLKVVRHHLDQALKLLSDRTAPDYRNSIKESISAVEGLCSLLAGQDHADLDAGLKVLDKKLHLHKALKSAFNSLYGYTSDANGIRHALLDEPSLSFEDAKFMLVACSAFINFLRGEAVKAGFKP